MKISCTSIALLFTSTLFGGASAFGIAPITASTTTSSSSISSSSAAKTTTALNYKPQHFDRAVECATTVGECDLDELESLANELEGVNNDNDNDATNNQDAGEVIKVKEILRAQHKFMAMNEEYQKEFSAARAAKHQLVSWPSEEDLQEEEASDEEPSQEIPQPSPSSSQTQSKQDGKKTPLVPMQVVYQDAKDFAMDVHDEYGPYARQLAYLGEDYFD